MEKRLPIPGYEGIYEVSDMGRIRSLSRILKRMNSWGFVSEFKKKGRILKPWPKPNGYMCIYLCIGGRKRVKMMHRLVALAFLSLDENKKVDVMHLNDIRNDNRLCNLRIGTRKENMQMCINHGRFTNYALSESQAREVFKLKPKKRGEWGATAKAAAKYNVSKNTISKIRYGKTRGHLNLNAKNEKTN